MLVWKKNPDSTKYTWEIIVGKVQIKEFKINKALLRKKIDWFDIKINLIPFNMPSV